MKRSGFSLCLAAAALLVMPAVAADAPIVGMLELQSQCKRGEGPGVRALFARSGTSWISLVEPDVAASYDLGHMDWTVSFDGRPLGTVRTLDPGIPKDPRSFHDRDYRLMIDAGQPLPSISNGREEFGGWCDVPEARPLVVNSQPRATDPDQWKPVTIADGYRDLLFDRFVQAFDEPFECSNLPSDHEFTGDDLIIQKSYQDNRGRLLVALRLFPNGTGCESAYELVSYLTVAWFSIADTVRHVGNGLELIDAGDYDNDGESEILFWYSAYNQDGYTILYDGLRWQSNYHWGYH